MRIAAEYYARTSYFKDLAAKILANPSFIPTEAQYKQMVENKYAQKVLDETEKRPKFEDGDLVTVSKVPYNHGNQFLAFIQQSDAEPVSSACKGAKKYRVLPFGCATTFVVEERYIRKAHNAKLEDIT
jgi:hypothetical protein